MEVNIDKEQAKVSASSAIKRSLEQATEAGVDPKQLIQFISVGSIDIRIEG